MVYRTVNTTVDVDVEVDLDDFEDEELQDELNRRRGWKFQSDTDLEDLLETWVYRRDQFEDKFRAYCREILGRSF